MISLEVFLIGLLFTSVLTGLVTEAVKKIMAEYSINYRANTLAGIVAAVLSAAIGTAYVLVTGICFTCEIIVCVVALIFFGWLCAMVGYDKVIQSLSQFKTKAE